MRILIVNKSNSEGGAAKAAFRLFESLSDIGIEVVFLSDSGNHRGKNVFFISSSRLLKINSWLRSWFDSVVHKIYLNRSADRFRSSLISNRRVVRAINSFNADLVHLHWVNDGFFISFGYK